MELAEILDAMPPTVAEKLKSGTFPQLSSEAYLEAKKNLANAEKGNLPGIDCSLCKNRGTITEIQGKYLVSVVCECMVKRRSLRNIEKSGLKEVLDRYTLDNFRTDEAWQAQMKRKAIAYLKSGGAEWFCALGSVGSGKTHLCTAVCGELLNKGVSVRYMLWRDESVKLKAAVNNEEKYETMIRPFKRAKVLYIDDLFKTKKQADITTGDINLAFEIINYRDSAGLQTIISSEMGMDEIIAVDEGIGSRIYKHCKNYCLELTGNKNRRLV